MSKLRLLGITLILLVIKHNQPGASAPFPRRRAVPGTTTETMIDWHEIDARLASVEAALTRLEAMMAEMPIVQPTASVALTDPHEDYFTQGQALLEMEAADRPGYPFK